MRLVYEQTDWGTERRLHLLDDNDKDLIAPRDPFWPSGFPVDENKRKRLLRKIGQEMIQEYEEKGERDVGRACKYTTGAEESILLV